MIADDEAIDVPAIVAKLSEIGELAALNYFWLMMREGAEPMTILAWMSHVVIARPADWDKAAIRQEHELGLGKSSVDRDQCYGCQSTTANLYFHHIIEIQNGGSNAKRNLVPLCFPCHKRLHPWLTVEPRATRGGGFVHIGTVIKEMLARAQMRNRK